MKPIGNIRRSQVLSGNGPGAIIDFRGDGGAPLSVVAAGLEAWDQFSARQGLLNDQRISHEPLQARLGVRGFRLPPVGQERVNNVNRDRLLPAYRFPDWHVCPKCELLQRSHSWGKETDRPELFCSNCSTGRGRRARKAFVVPVRFVVTCLDGHLQDFPWASWPRHAEGCRKKPLRLKGAGSGLKGLRVHCTECAAERDLDGALSPGTLKSMKIRCDGLQPWLKGEGCECANEPVAIQRGASNAYFPVIASALDVPPFGGSFRDDLERFWDDLKELDDPEQLPRYVRQKIHPEWPDQSVTADQLTAKIKTLLTILSSDSADLRLNEHMMLCSGPRRDEEFPEFKINPQRVPASLETYFSNLVSVDRLREVRALRGFTRLSPAEAEDRNAKIAPLSREKLNWLPAIEVRGEGVFLNFAPDSVSEWENREEVRARAAAAHAAAKRAWEEHNGSDRPFPMEISPRFLLVHTTAHALAERLSLDSGYSTASIRERLYVSPGPSGMCGVLLYTSAPDADGTLGGLSRKGRADELEPILVAALRDMEWCSSDPLCSTGILSLSEGSGSAACHCCAFVPETSCEHFNRHLDRGLLVGTPLDPSLGFFRTLLEKGN